VSNRAHSTWSARAGLAAVVTFCAAALALAGGAASPAGAARRYPAPKAVPASTAWPAPRDAKAPPVLLLNGDRVATAPGRAQSILLPAPGGGIVFGLHAGRHALFIPAAALPYLGRGLMPSLFDLASLRRAESGGRLPVQMSYPGRQPDLPGVTITRSAGGRAAGYLTASSARVFYAALARQFRADHGRASYGRDGLFAGGVTISLPGAATSRSEAIRSRPDFPMHTVTVTGTNLAGKPDTGDTAYVINAANWHTFSDPIEATNVFYHGSAKFSVPAGTYWAIGNFTRLGKAAGTGTQRLVVLPQFGVHGNQTRVHLDERAASSEVGARTPRPSAIQGWVFGLVRGGLHGTSLGIESYGFPGTYLRLSPTSEKPSVGSLHTYEIQTLASPPGTAGPPYVYNLALAGPAGIIPDQHTVIAQRSLATVTERFHQDVTSTGAAGTVVTYPKLGLAIGVSFPLRLPGLQTEYMTGTIPSVSYETFYSQFLRSGAGGQGGATRTLRPGQKLTEAWNSYPLHPQPAVQLLRGSLARRIPQAPTAFRMGDKLLLSTSAFSDNTAGHEGVGLARLFSGPHVKLSGSYAVYQDGVEIAHGSPVIPVNKNPFLGLPPVKLSHKRSLIRFMLSGARRGKIYELSPAFRTIWTWRSRPQPGAKLPPGWVCTLSSRRCAAQPMMTLDYQVHGMSLRGSTRPGPQAIGLTVGHLQLGGHAPITAAAVQVSFDGGKTWRRATVTRSRAGQFIVSFAAPAGTEVSLRTRATDAAGGSIAETIQDAYRVS
jgi:hypothetical protein